LGAVLSINKTKDLFCLLFFLIQSAAIYSASPLIYTIITIPLYSNIIKVKLIIYDLELI
jgi:hypothetical protein